MKSESIKSILRSYLETKQHSSVCDDIDGLPYAFSGDLSGESFDPLGNKASDLFRVEPQMADLPWDEFDYVPLEPEMEAIAVGIGRQLSQMSDEFRPDSIDVANQESTSVHFQEHIIRIPPTCDHISIPVARDGALDSVVNVEWRTCDKSAKAGIHYVYGQGNISFAEGDEEKAIAIQFIKGQDRKTDICFAVELFDAGGTFNTLMVYIVDESRLYPDEKQVVDNIFSCENNISVQEVATRLSDKVTRNTFKAALLCLCSTANSIPKELALGFELLRLTLPHFRLGSLTNIFCDYFSDLPELEDISSLFERR